METTERPLLFVDVDGPLNPYAAKPTRRPKGYVRHRMRPASWAANYPEAKPLRVWLNPAHGPKLLRLPVELVWATTWSHEANEWIGPEIGLPELPVVEWPERLSMASAGLFWKTQPVVEYSAGRPFAWVDDQITEADVRWCEERYPASTLLLQIDPALGLQDPDFATIARWAEGPAAAAGSTSADKSR